MLSDIARVIDSHRAFIKALVRRQLGNLLVFDAAIEGAVLDQAIDDALSRSMQCFAHICNKYYARGGRPVFDPFHSLGLRDGVLSACLRSRGTEVHAVLREWIREDGIRLRRHGIAGALSRRSSVSLTGHQYGGKCDCTPIRKEGCHPTARSKSL